MEVMSMIKSKVVIYQIGEMYVVGQGSSEEEKMQECINMALGEIQTEKGKVIGFEQTQSVMKRSDQTEKPIIVVIVTILYEIA